MAIQEASSYGYPAEQLLRRRMSRRFFCAGIPAAVTIGTTARSTERFIRSQQVINSIDQTNQRLNPDPMTKIAVKKPMLLEHKLLMQVLHMLKEDE